ncbi:MAG: hypothetical protein IPN40_18165 [Uliginosibacterium sp.]|nr:hypothetical protein [Uliginosibacterium sp.]
MINSVTFRSYPCSEKRHITLKISQIERIANVVGPHPQPFSRREKGANPLALWERDGVRAKHSPVLLYDQFVALNCSFRIDQSSLKSVSGMAVPQEQESLELPGYEARFPASGYFR